MIEAVADYSEATRVEQSSRILVPEHLVAACSNLVYIDKDGCFRLCHESVRGHLEKTPSSMDQPLAEYQYQKQNVDKCLAKICLNYLLLADFECGPAKSVGKLISLVKRYPFLRYTATFWGLHVSDETATLLHDLISKVALSPARRELSMQLFLYDPPYHPDLWRFTGSSNPLHILSMFGLKQTAETLPGATMLSREADGAGDTPLMYTLMGKHHEMSLWLIETILADDPKEALPLNAAQKNFAIHICANFGWADILKKLLSADETSVNSKADGDGLTPPV
jgi:hypothetical protein